MLLLKKEKGNSKLKKNRNPMHLLPSLPLAKTKPAAPLTPILFSFFFFFLSHF